MLRVVFNIDARNYYSKSTFNTSLIKQETVLFILVILYIREYLYVFTKPGIITLLYSAGD